MSPPTSTAETRTICPYCGVGCGLKARTERGRLIEIEGDPDYPVNRGRTCRKPHELPAAVHAADRARTPLFRERRDERFRPRGWGKVIAEVATRLRRTVAEHGPDSVAFYLSGQLLSEDYYAAVKLAKGFLGTNNVDSNSRLCMASAVAGYNGAFGSDGPPPNYADLESADCILLLGTNTAACHPIVWARIQDRRREGGFVACADPRPTQTAQGSDLHLPVRPGTDLALLNAMLYVIDREGLVDREYVERHTSGFEETVAVAREWPPARAEALCGVAAEDIAAIARRFAAGRSMVLWSMGANQSTIGTLKNRAMINLCLATGQIGRPGTGPLSLTGQPNAMGTREIGGAAQTLPGYRLVDSAEDRAEIERLWRVPADAPGISPEPGLTAVDLFGALEDGSVKAVWIAGTNPLVSMPDSVQARAALERAELVVVQDAYHPTETSALAHAVLPAAAWLEKEGVLTNSERRVALSRRALDPPGSALPDWRIFARLAAELGFEESFAWPDAAAVYDEIAAATAGRVCDQSGLSHAVLDSEREGVQWPRPEGQGSEERPAAPRHLYSDHRYPTPDGRARLTPTPHADPAEAPDEEYPFLLTTGRVANHWHTMTRTGKSEVLLRSDPEPFVELNPDDARRIGLEEGALALMSSRRGEVELRARLVEGVPAGVCFAPMHWGTLHAPPGAGQANAATHGAYDPVSRQPELKAAAVQVSALGTGAPARPARAAERNRIAGGLGASQAGAHAAAANGDLAPEAGASVRRLVVVGTGMAGLKVAETVVDRAPLTWRVTMLGEEDGPTYNRILLSKLLAGTASLADLELQPEEWYEASGVDLRAGSAATRVDPGRRYVVDARGERHPYDALVLATGSRPFVPPVEGSDEPHVHVFRTTGDAERIAKAAKEGSRAVVVGGGLLGLEAAAGLLARGVKVTAVELADRLMPQQLDGPAGTMLAARLADLGLEAHTGRGVASIAESCVRLDDGEELEADLVVIAAGIRPETSLATDAGIETGRGVLVDDELRTSEPRVFAVGECAEHRERVYGLWAPLADQARAAAAAVVGDPGGFTGATLATTLKVVGVDLFAGGAQEAGEGQDELVWSDGRRRVYRKLVLDGQRLVGAISVGDPTTGRTLTELIRTGADVPESLLDPMSGSNGSSEPSDEDIVCSCNRKTRGDILEAIRGDGLETVPQVAMATTATTGCGSCTAEVKELIEVAATPA